MKEFIEKLIGRLEEYRNFEDHDNLDRQCIDGAIEIVKQLAEEHNGGWIPCSERLPEEKENPITFDYMQYPVMVNIGGKTDVRYYYFGNGHWRLGFQIMDEYVTHWMDIKHYQQK